MMQLGKMSLKSHKDNCCKSHFRNFVKRFETLCIMRLTNVIYYYLLFSLPHLAENPMKIIFLIGQLQRYKQMKVLQNNRK